MHDYMFRFQKTYFALFLLLFCVEVLIAVFIDDHFVRPYLGDLLVVVLLYCFVRSLVKVRTATAVVAVLLFAYIIETAQYFSLVSKLGLEENAFAKTVLGSSFDWQDIVAYTLGAILILLVEKMQTSKHAATKHL